MNLKCIRCDTPGLVRVGQRWECQQCGSAFPIRNGVPRFVDEQLYTDSFGFQWNRFAKTQLDSANGTTRSRDTFIQKTGWDLDDLKSKRVLDAGCGMGRFAEVCADAGAEVHAVDLSTAVEAAFQNVGHRADVHVYQADIFNLPFPDKSFDFIYSIGVLHHTPNTKSAFLALPPLLKSGGSIAIWVYSRSLKLLLGDEILRRITSRLPKMLLLKASKIAIPAHHLHRIPVIRVVKSVLLPTSSHSDPEWRWLDTFDWYSAKYQWKHTYQEVQDWFTKAGLTEIYQGPIPVSVRGRRP